MNHLKTNGLLQIVFPSKVAERLANEIERAFGNVELLAKTSTHKVYIAKKLSNS